MDVLTWMNCACQTNCISRIENLNHQAKLQRLSLGHNYISTLEGTGLDQLHHLQYLSIDSNNLTSLHGLQRVTGLAELYVGNNNIQNIREVFYLKVFQATVLQSES